MKRTRLFITGILLASALLLFASIQQAAAGKSNLPVGKSDLPVGKSESAPVNAPDALTIIIVRTTEDPEPGSITRTCNYTEGIYWADPPCTFRRAIVEASARPTEDRPIYIVFNIPTDDPNYNAATETWTLQVDGTLHPLSRENTLDTIGNVTINGNIINQQGDEQPGPPRIFVDSAYSLEVESEGNTIRNLGWYGGGAIFLKENGNSIEKVWMGLTEDGQSMALKDDANPEDLAGGGFVILASDDNVISGTVVLGATGRAINIDGSASNNLIQNNYVGTLADGTAPDIDDTIECIRSLTYDSSLWYGGWGIQVSGSNNDVISNTIAGLHQTQSENDTPPMALEIFGSNHLIQGNVIGLDSAETVIGVCGQGIKIAGNNTEMLNNTIVRSRAGFEEAVGRSPAGWLDGAILLTDSSPTFGQITMRGNVVQDGPGHVILFGPGISDDLKLFVPPEITDINGTAVTGSSAAGSDCPNCLVDFYLDNAETPENALVYLGFATADSNGDFSFTLPAPLAEGEGIRTSATTQSIGIIGNFGSGTTTKLSQLYTPAIPAIPATGLTIAGPDTGEIATQYTFTFTVQPLDATTPFTYSVDVTDYTPFDQSVDSAVVTLDRTWTTPGTKTISVTAFNEHGSVSDSFAIEIAAPVSDSYEIFLPAVIR